MDEQFSNYLNQMSLSKHDDGHYYIHINEPCLTAHTKQITTDIQTKQIKT